MQAMPKDQQAKNGLTTHSTRKRKMLTFSEVTDIVVEERVRSEPQLWAVAKRKKMEGDDTLWNYLGEQRCIVSLLRKINGAWHPTETGRTLKAAPKYSLACFSVPSAVQEWVSTTHKSKALILSGRGEVGKTSLAAAALASVCGQYHFISSRDQIKGLIFLNSEGLLWDEACFAELDVDLCKGRAPADVVTCAVPTVSVVSSTDYASAAAAAAAAAVNTDATTALLLVENQKLTASTAPCITTTVS
eukprot:s1067_g9.t1